MSRILAIATASAAVIASLSVAAYWSIGTTENQAPIALPPQSPSLGAAPATMAKIAPALPTRIDDKPESQSPALQAGSGLRALGTTPSAPAPQPTITHSAGAAANDTPRFVQTAAEPRAASRATFFANRTGQSRSTQDGAALSPRQTSALAAGMAGEISTKPESQNTGADATENAQHDPMVSQAAQPDSSSGAAPKPESRQARALTPVEAVAAIPQPPEQPSPRRPRAWPKPFTPEEERLRQQIGVQAFINYQHELATGQKRGE